MTTNIEFVEAVKAIQKMKTKYAKGAFGAPFNSKNAIRYNVDGTPDDRTFLFDCCGLWHGALSGFCGDPTMTYGGTKVRSKNGGIVYVSGENEIPDWGADGAFSRNYLTNISNDMTNILPGEIVWIPGHNGIYIGNGWVIESTPRWNGGVQISQFKDKGVSCYREWLQHGRIPFLTYIEDKKEEDIVIVCPCCGAKFRKEN